MVSSFVKEIEGVTFTFNTMNVERLQLFQVYVMDNEVKKRFHVQLNEQTRFKIMDTAACPAFCLALEDTLHDAILENHMSSLNPTS
jgi:hypothetical protein